jgi:hypothetical protein
MKVKTDGKLAQLCSTTKDIKVLGRNIFEGTLT